LWIVPIVVLVLLHVISVNHGARPLFWVKVLFLDNNLPFDDEIQAARAMAEVKRAHGGHVFMAAKRRAYHGPRPFSSNGSTSVASYKLYPRSPERLMCKERAVVTTIFEPNVLVKQLAGMKDWCVVVVGDKKVRKFQSIFQPQFCSLVATLIMTSMMRIIMTTTDHALLHSPHPLMISKVTPTGFYRKPKLRVSEAGTWNDQNYLDKNSPVAGTIPTPHLSA
jgi:hypothetical protein